MRDESSLNTTYNSLERFFAEIVVDSLARDFLFGFFSEGT